jgi:hypothetical protein
MGDGAYTLKKSPLPSVLSPNILGEMPMLTFDSIPQARVVRKGGQQFAPLPMPRSPETSALREHIRDALAVAFGLWPLTAIVLLATGLLIMAGNHGAP